MGTKRKVCELGGGAPKDRALKVRENETRRLRAVTVGKAWHPARWDIVLALIASLDPLGKRLRVFATLFYTDMELRDGRVIDLLVDVLEVFIGTPDCNFRNIECHAFLGVAKNIGMVCDCDKDGNPIDWRRGRFEYTEELVVRAYHYALRFNGAYNNAGYIGGNDGDDLFVESFWLVEQALDMAYLAEKRMRVIDLDDCDADIGPTESTGGSDQFGLGAQPEAELAPAVVREAPGTPDGKVPVAAESAGQGEAEKKKRKKKKKGKGAAGTRAPTEPPQAFAAAASAAPTEVPVASAAAASVTVAPTEVPPAAAAAAPTEVPTASQAPPSAEADASEDTEMTAAADHAKQHQIDSNAPRGATPSNMGSPVQRCGSKQSSDSQWKRKSGSQRRKEAKARATQNAVGTETGTTECSNAANGEATRTTTANSTQQNSRTVETSRQWQGSKWSTKLFPAGAAATQRACPRVPGPAYRYTGPPKVTASVAATHSAPSAAAVAPAGQSSDTGVRVQPMGQAEMQTHWQQTFAGLGAGAGAAAGSVAAPQVILTNLIISVITAAMQGVLWQTLGGLGQTSGVSLGGSVVRPGGV